jgi:hypothetical protein
MKSRVGKNSGFGRFTVIVMMLLFQFSAFGLHTVQAASLTSAEASLPAKTLNSMSAMTTQATTTNPVLLIYNDSFSNVFSKYLGEIMKAEGLNLFDTIQLASVTATTLSSYNTVVLAQTSLTTTQASMFSSYVQGGGNLIAMRPDSKLASTMGLGTGAGTLSNGYMAVQTASDYGQGFVPDSLQLHTTADQYSGVTAQTVALLYSNATTPTIYPAVTTNNFGNGKAVAFTYDLPSNVVYTRQGNPALADIDADGDGITRTVDLYYNWIDLNKMVIPQADIQQRLFARILTKLNSPVRPLPRFWYFPNSASTTIVMTSDAHGNPDSYFQNLVNSMSRYNVTTSFYGRYGPTAASLAPWLAAGFTYNIHPYKVGNPSLTAGYQEAADWYTQNYGPTPTHTVRVHRLEDQGWVDGTKVAASFGYVMDYTYYRYGQWLKRADGSWARGYMMGSSMPMKTIDQSGQIVDVFAQYTEIADDQMNYPGPENLSNDDSYFYTKQAIDTSVGGTFQPVVIQAHVDYYASEQSWFESTMAYGRAQNLPFMNGDAWSDFAHARYNSTFSNLSWANNQLSFSMSVPTGQTGQTIMLPATTNTSNIQTVQINNATTTFTTKTVSGENFAMVVVPAGTSTVTVTYQPDTVPPVISNVTVIPSGAQAQINWTTDELSTSKVNYGTTASLGSTATSTGYTSNHTVQLTGLTVGQTYFYQVVSSDQSNNTATSPTTTFVATNAAPTISQVTPPTIVNNQATTINITGTNFVNSPAVLLGSQALTGVTFNSTSSLTAQIPAGVTPGVYNLTVTNPDNASATLANSITVKLPAPNLTTVNPNSGANNASTPISLNGTNFVSGATVRLGAANLSGVAFVSAIKLTATVPAGLNQGVYDLTVTNPDGQISTLAASFTVGPPSSGPTLSQVSPSVLVNVNANTVTLNGGNFNGPVTVSLSGTNQAGVTLVNSSTITFNLAANYTPGTYDVTVTNNNGQSATLTGGLVVLPSAVINNTQADFASGTFSNTVTTARQGGEIKLKASLEDYFTGTTLNSSVWTTGTWTTGGTVTPGNGALAVQGGYAHTLNNMALNRLEFTAKFSSNSPNQHIGYSPDLSTDWILFSVPGFDTSRIYARSSVNGTSTDTPLNVSLDTFHDFLITVVPGSINFFADGVLVATHNVTANNPALVWFSNGTTNGALVVDNILAGQYPTSGSYLSAPLDAGQVVTWSKLNWQLNLPSTTSASLQARTSNDAANWTAWSSGVITPGDAFLSLNPGRYLQYNLNLASNDPAQSPEILSVAGVYGTVTPGPLARIAITPASSTLAVGATQQYGAQGFDSNNVPITGLTFTWSTSTGGAINPTSGLYTAGSVVGNYPASVLATSGNITGTADVNIRPNPPAITSVTPNTGATNVATTVSINGSNFITGATAKLGTTSLGSVTFVSAAKLTAVVPAGLPQGVYDLTVTNPDTQQATLSAAFTVGPPASGPTITKVIPAVVSNSTANTITLTGLNFTAPVTVALSGVSVSGVTVTDPTSLTFNLPVGYSTGNFDLTVTNATGQNATVTGGLVVLPQAVIQNTQADFATGTLTNLITTSRLDGEIKLKSPLEDQFAGAALDSNLWLSGTWASGGSTTTANGLLSVLEAYAHTNNQFALNRLSFRAKFSSNAPNQHIGYSDDLSSGWILFSIPGWDTSHIYARSSVNGVSNDTPLTVSLDTFHDFTINVLPASIQFVVDGSVVASHPVAANNPTLIWFSNATTNNPLVVESIQAGPYVASGTYLSAPLDAGQSVTWNRLNWQLNQPAGTTATIQARTSTDGANWSNWSSPASTAGNVPLSLAGGRYLQYQLNLGTSDTTVSPEVLSVAGVYGSGSGPLAQIVVTPATANLLAGATQQFSAQGYDGNNTPLTGLTYTWTTTGGGTISSSGVYTAGLTGGSFPASVIASSGVITGGASVVITPTAPTLSAISPATGSNNITNTITITGTNFVATPVVKLGTTALTGVNFVSATNVTAVVPAGLAAGVYTLTVTNPDSQQATLANAYTSSLPAPTITTLAPNNRDNAITRTMTITGTNFVATPTVKLGSTTLASVTFVSTTQLTALVPVGFTPGTYALTVTNPDGKVATLNNAYTATAAPTLSQNTSNFNSGTYSGTGVTLSGSTNEVGLSPSFEDEFTGSSLSNTNWSFNSTGSPGGSATVSGNGVSVRGGFIRSRTNYTRRVVEGRVIFPTPSSGTSQDFGWGSGNSSLTSPWAMFGVPSSNPNGIYARTNIGSTQTDTRITSLSFNTYYNLRVVVGTTTVTYYVNNVQVAQHTVSSSSTNTGLNIFLYNSNTSTGSSNNLQADWIRIDNFPSTGKYTSATFDSGSSATTWTSLNWAGTLPTGTGISVQVQTSSNGFTWNTLSSGMTTPGTDTALTGQAGRYLRYVVTFTPTSDSTFTPTFSGITLTYTTQS